MRQNVNMENQQDKLIHIKSSFHPPPELELKNQSSLHVHLM